MGQRRCRVPTGCSSRSSLGGPKGNSSSRSGLRHHSTMATSTATCTSGEMPYRKTPETTVSGIVLPDTAKEKPQRGRVLAVGPGARDEDGNHIAMDLEEGDEVIFSKYGGTEIKLGTDEVLILRESDVLAKVVGDRAAV